MYGHVITKYSRMGSLPYFLTHGAPQAHQSYASNDRALLVRCPRHIQSLFHLIVEIHVMVN